MLKYVSLLLLAAIPRIITYEGKITDPTGIGINDTLSITFRLYSSESSPHPIWEERIENVAVTRGLFAVQLGSINPFPDTVDFSDEYWMEIEIDGERLSPRERLSSVPYSMRASFADNAIQSVSSSYSTTGRTGHLRYIPFSGSSITESASGDTIYIAIGGSSVAGVSSITGAGAIFPNTRSTGDVIISTRVDNSTIEINELDRLQVKENGITSAHIQDSSLTGIDIRSGSLNLAHLGDFAVSSPTIGSLLYFDGSVWRNLPAGREGDVLTSQGSTEPPLWRTLPGGISTMFLLLLEPDEGLTAPGCTLFTTLITTFTTSEPESVTFSAIGLPTGVSVSFSPSFCFPTGFPLSCTTLVSISVAPFISTLSRDITIMGTSRTGYVSTVDYRLTVGRRPGAVTNLIATGNVGHITLTWSAPDDGGFPITGYEIFRSTSPEPTTRIATISPSLMYVDSTGLVVGTVYYYRIRALNTVGAGEYSNEAFANVLIGSCSTFVFTGEIRSFVVPDGVTSVSLEVWGAQGSSGGSGGGIGGRGGYVGGSLRVTPGTTLYICVGGQNGWNTGGNGGSGSRPGGSGGGASYVSVGRSSIAYAVLIAGGGGGGGGVGQTAGPAGVGGAGGGFVAYPGGNGQAGGRGASGGNGGGGGSDTTGGSGGSGSVSGMPGLYGSGGDGGNGWNSSYSGSGGGGGGGYFGGGGGGGGSYVYYSYESPYHFGGSGGGGGGGSSFIDTTRIIDGRTAPGVRSGDGIVIICW